MDDRGVRGSRLGETGHRVGLLPPYAVGAEDVVPVQGPLADALHEQRPHPSPGHQRESVAGPRVEVALDPDGLRVGRPDREPGAPDLAAIVVRDGDHMRAEQPPARGVGTRVERREILAGQPTPGILHASHCLPDHARADPGRHRSEGLGHIQIGPSHAPSLPPALLPSDAGRRDPQPWTNGIPGLGRRVALMQRARGPAEAVSSPSFQSPRSNVCVTMPSTR